MEFADILTVLWQWAPLQEAEGALGTLVPAWKPATLHSSDGEWCKQLCCKPAAPPGRRVCCNRHHPIPGGTCPRGCHCCCLWVGCCFCLLCLYTVKSTASMQAADLAAVLLKVLWKIHCRRCASIDVGSAALHRGLTGSMHACRNELAPDEARLFRAPQIQTLRADLDGLKDDTLTEDSVTWCAGWSYTHRQVIPR